MLFHRFHDDNRVVHDEANSEHEGEQRQRVDREPQQRKHGEGADERHRHGNQRDERRPPVLQEEEDDENDQDHGLEERVDDLADALGHRQRRVECDCVVEVSGEPAFEVRERAFDAVRGGQRIGAGRLIDGDDGGGLPVHARQLLIVEGAQFDAGHVLHAHDGAVQVGADDDLAKLLRRLEPPLREHRVRLLHALGRRRRAHLARRVDRALLLDRGDEVGHGEPEFGQHIRLHPDAHGVIAGPEQPYLPHARHAVEDVVDVNIGVVREEQ